MRVSAVSRDGGPGWSRSRRSSSIAASVARWSRCSLPRHAPDPIDLGRFVQAQDSAMHDVRRQLQLGRTRTHWTWFVFPQLRALGRSPTASPHGLKRAPPSRIRRWGRAWWTAQNSLPGRTAHEMFGSPDDLKLHSSMTLCAVAAPDRRVFGAVIIEFFRGQPDRRGPCPRRKPPAGDARHRHLGGLPRRVRAAVLACARQGDVPARQLGANDRPPPTPVTLRRVAASPCR